jgi:molybdopterin-binding protein
MAYTFLYSTKEDTVKLSTRNQIKGEVIEVVKGQVAATVKVDIGGGNTITSMITVLAVDDLQLKKGDKVTVLVKATSVMIGK